MDNSEQYRKLIEKLIYLIITRPDIAYIVMLLSQFIHKPKQIHWTGIQQPLAYIKSTLEKGLLYQANGYLRIEAFLDVSCIEDKMDRKSTSGYLTYVRGNLVTWKSKKQNIVTCYSCELEYK